jgi:hypothetical protein
VCRLDDLCRCVYSRTLLDFGLFLQVWYVSSMRLPNAALLSFDIINAGLPWVALLFLLQLKCGAVIPNCTTTPEGSSLILQSEGCHFKANRSHQACLELASCVKDSSHCLCVLFGSNWTVQCSFSLQGKQIWKIQVTKVWNAYIPSIDSFLKCANNILIDYNTHD